MNMKKKWQMLAVASVFSVALLMMLAVSHTTAAALSAPVCGKDFVAVPKDIAQVTSPDHVWCRRIMETAPDGSQILLCSPTPCQTPGLAAPGLPLNHFVSCFEKSETPDQDHLEDCPAINFGERGHCCVEKVINYSVRVLVAGAECNYDRSGLQIVYGNCNYVDTTEQRYKWTASTEECGYTTTVGPGGIEVTEFSDPCEEEGGGGED